MKIKLHSMTDLITNSSTVIYTYSDASLGACKDMIDEIFRVSGVDKKCDDVFSLSIRPDNYDRYHDALDELDKEDVPAELRGLSWKDLDDGIEVFLDKISLGEIPKPQWVKDVENGRNYDYKTSTTLNILPKSPEYAKLAELVSNFLYSTNHEASYNG